MSTEQKFCSECGAPLEESDRFCPVCGAKVDDVDGIGKTKSSEEESSLLLQHNKKIITSSLGLEKEISQNDNKTSSENHNSNNVGLWATLVIVLLVIAGGVYVYIKQENQKVYTETSDTLSQEKAQDSNKPSTDNKSITLLGETYNPDMPLDSSINTAQTSNNMSASKKVFWADVAKISALKGDTAVGEAAFAICAGCHMDGAGNMGGVIPPVLDHAGAIYDKDYLVALVKDPAIASNVDHLYRDTSLHPMGSIKYMIPDDQDIADLVAYIMKEKSKKPTPEQAFLEACSRCHAVKSANITQLGKVPNLSSEYGSKVDEEEKLIKNYLGKLPPDLSNITNKRSEEFLVEFIKNPQSKYHNSAMPSIGLSKDGYRSILLYLKGK